MQTRWPAFSCSTMELAFLASLLGADSLTGVPDPFAGWAAHEIDAAWEQVRPALAERRLVAFQPDGSVTVDGAVAELVGTCGFAEATFMLTYTSAAGAVAGHHFHAIRQSAVELVFSQEAVLSCELKALDTGDVLPRVAELFHVADQGAPAAPNGRLTAAALRRAQQVAEESGQAAAEVCLRDAGLPAETATALAGALARPVGNGALVALSGTDVNAGVDGLALLEGADGFWLLRNVARERCVDVVPCTAADLREFIRSVMNRALPGLLL